MDEHIVFRRLVNILAIFFIMLIYSFGLCYRNGFWLDQILCLLAVDVSFFVLLVFLLEHNRKIKNISANTRTDYRKVMTGILVSSAIFFGCSFFPEFVKPVLLTAVFMTALSNELIAVTVCIGLAAILAVTEGFSSYELIENSVLILSGCVLAAALENGKIKKWCCLTLFFVSVLIPPLFYYFHYQKPPYSIMIWGGIEGAAISLLLFFVYDRLLLWRSLEVNDLLADMLDEEYPLVKELKQFSKTEFLHAKRVSEISMKCARVAGVNELVCAAAGFYYRIGIMEGDQIAENGERLAEKYCFPEEICLILREYQGMFCLPTTTESAIVQMVDGLIKKLEALEQVTKSSDWNQGVVVYQTLSEYSKQGMYDKSGLSMNQFLKIREYLLDGGALV